MPDFNLLHKLKNILAQNVDRAVKAARITEAIRDEGGYRWVGIYDVDIHRALVPNLAWSGPGAPAFPTFPITKGLTSRGDIETPILLTSTTSVARVADALVSYML